MTLRPELPPTTVRIEQLPVHRGYPVPWFVAWLNDAGDPVGRGHGTPDFRILYPGAVADAIRYRRCWICGGRLGQNTAFVVGPMCAVNRTSSEPPSHVDCAEWAARACPFLTRPKMTRREAGLPETEKPAGIMLERNPGVALVWVTRRYHAFGAITGGVLFNMGTPERVVFYAEGRLATRAEIEASIESGLPALRELAEQQGGYALRALDECVARARELLPA